MKNLIVLILLLSITTLHAMRNTQPDLDKQINIIQKYLIENKITSKALIHLADTFEYTSTKTAKRNRYIKFNDDLEKLSMEIQK